MNSIGISHSIKIAVVLGFMGVAYVAGSAESADSMTLPRLQSAVDFLVKARALLDAAAPLQGAIHVRNAEAAIDRAIGETKQTIAANGG